MPRKARGERPGLIGRFWREESGAAALTFGLMLIPMVAMIGLAVDFGHVYAANSKTQGALRLRWPPAA